MKNFRLTLNQKYGYANIFFGVSFVLMALFIKSGNIYLSMSSTLLNLVAVLGLLLTLMTNVLWITFIGLLTVL